MRRGERLFAAALIALILALGLGVCSGPEERIAFLFYDDAYYYFGVARHLAQGAGSTFDGLNPTNGYHPLWCWLLVPVFLVVEDPGLAVRIIGFVWFVLVAAAAVSLAWALRPRTGPFGAWLAAALFALQPHVGLGLARPNGLETPLYAAALALFLGLFERVMAERSRGGGKGPSLGTLYFLGCGLGVVVLARLDAGLLAVATAILVFYALSRGTGPKAAFAGVLVLTAGGATVAGPSLAWNQIRFGHPMPISGRVVSHFAAQERVASGGALSRDHLRSRFVLGGLSLPERLGAAALRGTPLDDLPRRAKLAVGAFAAVGVALAAWVAKRRRAEGGPLSRDALGLAILFALLHYGVYVAWLWTRGEEAYRLYYFMPQVMAVVALLGAGLGPPLGRRLQGRRVGVALTFGTLVLLSVHAMGEMRARLRENPPEPGPLAERHIYGWIRREIPEGAVLGARDAGKLGFFSGRKVVNLDGLGNDERLLAAIQSGREAEYIADSPIGFLLIDRTWLGGFDPSTPGLPPVERRGFGETVFRLGRIPGITVRERKGAPDGWAVLEVSRDQGSAYSGSGRRT